ncbi:MAG: nucleoside hydrolase [Coxiellaceae bacterium]|nr:nucleoside hydrolase [Coxiellaceae bacterium]
MRQSLRIFLLLISLCCLTTGLAKPLRYIMDTDMGFDDWLAVEYLLEQPVDIAAITVDCQGLTNCPQGGVNAAKLTRLAHRTVPIAMGNTRPSSQFDFPKPLREFSSAMNVPGFQHLAADDFNPTIKAAELIANTIIKAAKKHQRVAIISIGTATNIADAWQVAVSHHQQTLFRQGLAMIYKGGGAFGQIKHHKITNKKIHGNLSIPGIYQSNNHSGEWNLYANAPAMQMLLNARLPITFIPNNATDQVNMTEKSYHQLFDNSSAHSPRRFSANAMLSVITLQGGWKKIANNLDFWDTSVTLASLDPTLVAEQISDVPIKIIEKPGNHYSATWVTKNSPHHVNVYYRLHVKAFYSELLSHLH